MGSGGEGTGVGGGLGPELVALSVTAAWFPVNGLIHERPPLSRQAELWESFQEGSFGEDLWDVFISTYKQAHFQQ